MEAFDSDHPMQRFSQGWLNVLHSARKARERFDVDADEAMSFYSGKGGEYMWGSKQTINGPAFASETVTSPDFKVNVNKAYEAVSVFGPKLYYQNPHRQVNPRKQIQLPPEVFGNVQIDEMTGMPLDPMAYQAYQQYAMQSQQADTVALMRAELLEAYLNYTPNELGLIDHMRRFIDEAIVKGLACIWTEVYRKPGSQMQMVGSFYEPISRILIDPDVDHIDDALWISRDCYGPRWQVEQEYGLDKNALKGHFESREMSGRMKGRADEKHQKKTGKSADIVKYTKIYSKMGLGDLMSDIPEELKGVFAEFGPYVYLVVCEGVKYPLNLPPQLVESLDENAVFDAVQWPTPFWADDKWPCTFLRWRDVAGELYPIGLLTPAMGELKAINWCASTALSKVRNSAREYIATLKSASPATKKAVKEGGDLTHLDLEDAVGDDIGKVVQFLSHPEMNSSILTGMELFSGLFDKRTGMTGQAYGLNPEGTQPRSAADARIKAAGADIRADDMANTVETAATNIARLEGIAARYHLTGEDVKAIVGDYGAAMWDQFVSGTPLDVIIQETEFRIEAGSARKPNKDRDADNLAQAMQVLGTIYQQYAMSTGDSGPLNALVAAWAKSIDMESAPFTLGQWMVPMPAAPAEGEPNQEQAA